MMLRRLALIFPFLFLSLAMAVSVQPSGLETMDDHCEPGVRADAGPDQTVTVGKLVQLDGKALISPYCESQYDESSDDEQDSKDEAEDDREKSLDRSDEPEYDPEVEESGNNDHESEDDEDSENSVLTFTWRFLELPAGSEAILSGATLPDPTFEADLPGDYTLELVVYSDDDTSSSDTVTISAYNTPPVANAGPDQTARVTDTIALDGTRSNDPDGDPLTFGWTLIEAPAGSAATLSDPFTVNPSFVVDHPGNYVAELVVNDGLANSVPGTVQVSTVNSPPVANAGADRSLFVTDTMKLDGSASTDVDGDRLYFLWTLTEWPDGSNAALDDPTAVDPSFVLDVFGRYVAELVVSDGLAESAPDAVVITTLNSSPVAHAGPDQTATITDIITLDGSRSSDFDGDALSYSWSFVSRPADSVATLSDPTLVDPFFQVYAAGTYVVQLVVDDGQVKSAADTVTIETVNSPPVAEAGLDQAVFVGDAISLDGSGSSDVDGDLLSFFWALTVMPEGSFADLSAPDVTAPTFGIDLPGTYVAQLIVNDGQADSAPDTVTITTKNSPPVADAGPDQTAFVRNTISLDGSGSNDADADLLTFAWSLISKPAESTAALDQANSAQPELTVDAPGTYVAQLIVSDGLVDSAPATIRVIANLPNRAPVITSAAVTAAEEGAPYSYNVEAADPDIGDALTFSLISAPNGMQINGTTGLISWVPSHAQVGQHSVHVMVEDAAKLSDLQTYTLAVTSAPILVDAGGDRQVTEGESLALPPATFSVQIQGASYTASVDWGDGVVESATVDQASRSVTGEHSYSQAGVFTVRVCVLDDAGASGCDEFITTVAAAPMIDLTVADIGTAQLSYGTLDASGGTPSGAGVNIFGEVTARVANAGGDPVDAPFQVLFFEDVNFNGTYEDGEDTPLGASSVATPITAGGTIDVAASLSGTVDFPGVPIWAFVDSNNAIAETDEGNNLDVSAASCTYVPPVETFNPVVEWVKDSFTAIPDSGQVLGTPAVADLNEDGIPDIVFSTYVDDWTTGGTLRAISGDGGSELWSITGPLHQVATAAGVALGDIDSDGLPEIIAVHLSEGLIAFEHDGTFKWKSQGTWGTHATYMGGPSIADLNGDGVPEIVISATVLDNLGNILWDGTAAGGEGVGVNQNQYGVFGSLSIVADLDLDGSPEVVAGKSAYRADGSLYWNAAMEDGFSAVANFDADPYPEVALVSRGDLYLLEHTGELKWGPVGLGGVGAGGPPTIADVDGDGELEIGVAGFGAAPAVFYTVFEADGTLKWRMPAQDLSAMTGSSVFDFEGDGSAEIVYNDELHLRIYNGADGAIRYELPKGSGTGYELPVIADVDADGNAEIVAVANDYAFGAQRGIYVIGDVNDTWVPTRTIWNQHSYHITNVNDDGTIPAVEQNSWQVHNTYRLNALPGARSPHTAPDLLATYVRFVEKGTQVTLTVRIGNAGAVEVGSGLNIAFYNGEPGNGGNSVGVVQTTGRIPAGAHEDLSITLSRADAAALWVVADDNGSGQGKVNECNEVNNIHRTDVQLNNLPPVIKTTPPLIVEIPATLGDPRVVDLSSWSAVDYNGGNLGGPGQWVLSDGGTTVTQQANGEPTIYLSDFVLRKDSIEGVLRVPRSWDDDYIGFVFGFQDSEHFYLFDWKRKSQTGPITGELGEAGMSLKVVSAEQPLSADWAKVFWPTFSSSDQIETLFHNSIAWGYDTDYHFKIDFHPGEFTIAVSAASPLETIHIVDNTYGYGRFGFFNSSMGPVVYSGYTRQVLYSGEYGYDVDAIDPDGDQLTYTLLAGPTGMTIDSSTGQITWLLAPEDIGKHSVSVVVDDGRGGTNQQDFFIEAYENHPPTITSVPVVAAETQGPYTYDVEATDLDAGDALTFALHDFPDGMKIDPATGVVSWIPNDSQVGNQTVTVSVTDPAGLQDTQTFVIAVSRSNTAPTITSAAITTPGKVSEEIVVDFDDVAVASYTKTPADHYKSSGVIFDKETPIENVSSVESSFHDGVFLPQGGSSPNALSLTPHFDPNLEIEAYFVIPGTLAPSKTSTVSVHVFDGPANSGTSMGRLDAYDAAGSLLDTVELTTPVGGGGEVYSIAHPEIARVRLLQDEDGGVFDNLTFNYQRNYYQYAVQATDPEGDVLAYTLDVAPAGMVIDAATGHIQWMPSPDAGGDFSVTVTATDPSGLSDSQTFVVRIPVVNQPPVITSSPVLLTVESQPYSYDVEAADPNADPLSYSLASTLYGTTQAIGDVSSLVQISSETGQAVELFEFTVPTGFHPGGLTYHKPSGNWLVRLGKPGTGQSMFGVLDPQTEQLNVFEFWGMPGPGYFVEGIEYQSTTDQILITIGDTGTYISDRIAEIDLYGNVLQMSADLGLGDRDQIAEDPSTGTLLALDFNGDLPRIASISDPFGMARAAAIASPPVDGNAYDVAVSETGQIFLAHLEAELNGLVPVEGDRYGEIRNFNLSSGKQIVGLAFAPVPDGMSIDPATGLLTWIPAVDQGGVYPVSVRVTDSGGLSVTQSFVIDVRNINQPPVITSTAPTLAPTGLDYSYQIVATDPDGDPLTYTLVNGPAGMTLSPDGLITWPATDTRPTTAYVRVEVSDSQGASTAQAWSVQIQDSAAPVVSILMSSNMVSIGEPVSIQVQADSPVEIQSVSASVSGAALALDGSGIGSYTATAAGFFDVRAVVSDVFGKTGEAIRRLSVADPNDATSPSAASTNLGGECFEATDLYPITGTISDDTTAYYELRMKERGVTAWIPFASGQGQSITGQLGVFDPTVLRNGIHDVQLYVVDPSGRITTMDSCAIVSGKLKVGQVGFAQVELALPAPGIPLTVGREYDSRAQGPSDFGPGWNLANKGVRLQTPGELGAGWGQQGGASLFDPYVLFESQQHVLVISYGDGETDRFRMDVNPKTSQLVPLQYLTVSYVPEPGTEGSAEALDDAPDVILNEPHLMTYNADTYAPRRFSVTRRDGSVFVLSMDKGIESITDANGNTVNYSDTGISHSNGASISFQRGTGNRIERITDNFGGVYEYYYDADGYLERVEQIGQSQGQSLRRVLSSYGYSREIFGNSLERKLAGIVAPDGTQLGAFEYDAIGRMTALIDADGNRVIYGYDVPNHTQTITDRLGNVSTYEFDNRGNVTQKTDPLGNLTRWEYDGADNEIAEVLPNGARTELTFNASGDMLTETDPLGNVTHYSYDAGGRVLTRTDALGRVYTTERDSRGNAIRESGPGQYTTESTYDGNGNLLTQKGSAGIVTALGYDGAGQVTDIRTYRASAPNVLLSQSTQEYDAQGRATRTVQLVNVGQPDETTLVTENVYDVFGNLVEVTTPAGTTQQRYDISGQRIASADHLGRWTHFVYDAQGQLVKTILPDERDDSDGDPQAPGFSAAALADNPFTASSHDAEGRLQAVTDLFGNQLSYRYDAVGRRLATVHPDGTESRQIYDAAGNLITSTDRLGGETLYTFDLLGRQLTRTDALAHVWTTEYDAVGNRVRTLDPLGRPTAFEYDEGDRLVRTLYPGGSSTSRTYDLRGNTVSQTDQAGRTTILEYDDLDRLVAVEQLVDVSTQEVARTEYQYDQQGRKIAQIDALGRTTGWTYDAFGRETSRILPLGQTETFTYLPDGRRNTHTDFNGLTTLYDYDSHGRLVGEYWLDGIDDTIPDISYTYDFAGRLVEGTKRGVSVQYAYDGVLRAIGSLTYPGIGRIEYEYDALGRRTGIRTSTGPLKNTRIRHVGYTYDALSRLDTVMGDHGVTDYTYNALGNLIEETTSQDTDSTTTTRGYDDLNRVTSIAVTNGAGDVIASYSYRLDPSGMVEHVEEHGGRIVDYSYDAMSQLISEQVTEPGQPDLLFTFEYDKVGNRIRHDRPDGDVVTYAYDDNDRLLSETSTISGANNYSYNDNGQLIGENGPDKTATYVYDPDERLISAEVTTGTETIHANYVYDHNDNRVGRSLTDAGGTAQSSFLVDPSFQFAQVLEEQDVSGNLTTAYTLGNDLIAQTRGGTPSYYHHDRIGSVRQLCNAGGSKLNTYTYEAYGDLLNQTGVETNRYKYTGEQEIPELGWYHLRARNYMPRIGRFWSIDPFGGLIRQPLELNKYNYVTSNPSNTVDPSGRYGIDVHLFFAYKIAHFLELDENVAVAIAWASQHVDEDQETEPLRGFRADIKDIEVRQRFHFPHQKKGRVKQNDREVKEKLKGYIAANDAVGVGVLLHVYKDTYAHSGFESKWGHGPASIMLYLRGETQPDQFDLGSPRDMEMAENVFHMLQGLSGARNDVTFSQFIANVRNRNRIGILPNSYNLATINWQTDFSRIARSISTWHGFSASPHGLFSWRIGFTGTEETLKDLMEVFVLKRF